MSRVRPPSPAPFRINDLHNSYGKKWSFSADSATKYRTSVTRSFPYFSSWICFSLWRVCGEFVSSRLPCLGYMAVEIAIKRFQPESALMFSQLFQLDRVKLINRNPLVAHIHKDVLECPELDHQGADRRHEFAEVFH